MGSKRTTHIRVDRDIVNDFHKEMPGVSHADIVRISWANWKAINKAGKFVYGNVWKKLNKK